MPIAAFENSGGGADIAFDQHGKLAEVGDIVDYANLIEHLADDPDVTENCRLFSNEIKEKNSFINYCQSLETDFDSIFNTPGKEEPSDTSHDEREGN